jgi:hypothetical protein
VDWIQDDPGAQDNPKIFLHGFILDLPQANVKKSNKSEKISIPVIRRGFGK